MAIAVTSNPTISQIPPITLIAIVFVKGTSLPLDSKVINIFGLSIITRPARANRLALPNPEAGHTDHPSRQP
jgi:hypothetical protein